MLTSYISEYLAPKNLRLEFKNRIENLCSLSGSPMSPALRQWVIQTFGLEMVRVIEGYSSLTAPVLSPQLQERINRIVPKNYQGEDVNLLFKQLFDVTCVAPLCLYNSFIIDNNCNDFTDPGWDIGGFGVNFNDFANSFGGYDIQDGVITCGVGNTGSFIQFYYLGSSPPSNYIVNDPFQGVSYTNGWSNMCLYGCLTTGSIRWNNSPYEWMRFNFSYISANAAIYGGPIDFSLGAQAVEDILVNMLTKYQPQASVNVIDDGGGFFTITFNDLYYYAFLTGTFELFYNGVNDVDSCNMTPC